MGRRAHKETDEDDGERVGRVQGRAAAEKMKSFPAAALVTALAALVALFVQTNLAGLSSIGIASLTIPDTLSLNDSINRFAHGLLGTGGNFRTYAAVAYLYYLGGLYSKYWYYAVNAALLIIAVYYFAKIAKEFNEEDDPATFFSAVFLSIFNPYIIAALAFPNKEIPLIALFNAISYYLLVRKKTVLPLLLCVPSIWVRDGFFVILLVILFGYKITVARIAFSRWVVIFGMIAGYSLVSIDVLAAVSAAVRRSIETASILQGEGIKIFSGYITRLYYTVFSFPLFNPILDERSHLKFIDLGYFLLGFIVLAALLFSVSELVKKEKSVSRDFAFFILTLILSISYSIYIQPRYLFPAIFVLSYSALQRIGSMGVLLVACLAINFALMLAHQIA